MPIVVNSPFSGKPVKIRDQDVNRAVRDEENRIFYVLPLSTGAGYYASPTRQGGAKEEERYLSMAAKTGQMADNARAEQTPLVHNAAGRPRSGKRGKLVILVFVVIIAAVGYWMWNHRDQWQKGPAAGDVPLNSAPASNP